MSITVEAVYENGVLKLSEPLPFKEHEKISVTVEPKKNWVQETAGMIAWTGSQEELRAFALDPAFDPEESA